MLAFFTITHLDTSGAFSRTLAQREPRNVLGCLCLESVLRCRVAQPPGVAQQVHKTGSVDAVAPLSSHWGLQPGATTTCDTLRAGEKALGFFFCCWFPHWDSLRSPTHGDKGKASGPTTPSLRSFNKFLISKLAVMPIHLFPHFLELVG